MELAPISVWLQSMYQENRLEEMSLYMIFTPTEDINRLPEPGWHHTLTKEGLKLSTAL